ncbi:MAG: DUF3662 domain-containing protein [Acidobacteria bacterium]|nr:DUF3662 domain-containing protein [Acidobacteriota bacterium]
MDFVKKLKEWLDGEELEELPVAKPPQQEGEATKLPKREEFIVKVAREVAKVMEEEKLEIPPDGQIMMPSKYVIFLSKEDDEQWRGKIREGLERGLQNLVSQRAKEIIGSKPSNIKSLIMDLHVDSTLENGQVKVQPDWNEEEKTRVVAHKNNTPPRTPAVKSDDEDAKTVIRPRAVPALFSVEYTRNGGEKQMQKVFKDKIAVGRSEKADFMLEGDREISRIHAEIERLAAGRYKVTCTGQNGLEAGASWLEQNQSREIAPGEAIKIGPYELKITES